MQKDDRVIGSVVAWSGLAAVLLARVYRAMLLTLVIAAAVPTLWSWSSVVVRSGSMEPALTVGDVVITKPFAQTSPVPVGRVMLFTTHGAAAGHERRLHRVVEKLGDGTYVTAGDANRSNDVSPVPVADFRSQAVICVPLVGLPLAWWNDGKLTLLGVWVLLTVIAFYISSCPPPGARHRRGHGRPDVVRRPVRTGVRTSTATAAALILTAAPALPSGSAGAAFTDATDSRANTWKIAVNSSRAASQIQVYDTISATGWYQRGNVAVNIWATASGGRTIRSITYRVNGGSPVTIKSSSLTFTLSTQGDSIVTYFATDSAGAAEAPHTARIKLDNLAPTMAMTSRTGDMTHAQWRTACAGTGVSGGACGTLVDQTSGSGVERVDYVLFRSSDSRCFTGTTWTSAACQSRTPAKLGTGTWLANVPDSVLATARTWYTIVVYAQDVAGNTTTTTSSFSVG